MRITLAVSIGIVAAGLGSAAPAQGQTTGMPTHEFGVDLGVAYHNIASSVSGGSSVSEFSVATPVDLRVGFISASPTSLELRLVASLLTASGGGATVTAYSLMPDVNVLYKLGAGHGPHNLLGPYFTAGVGAGLSGISDGSSTSGVNVTINVGVGARGAFGTGATRGEFFVAYTPKNDKIGPAGNEITMGVRLGISLWH